MKKERCPNCGYCPECGRSNQPANPINPWPPIWFQSPPYQPVPVWVGDPMPWETTKITCGRTQ